MNNIANNIKNLRKAKGLSQEQLAEQVHVTRQTVSAWERGMAQPSLDTLGKIAGALGVETEQLLYDKAAGPRKPVYQAVSFWPVLGVIPLYYLAALCVLPAILMKLLGAHDAVFIISGQLFLSMLLMFCYCSLKDEIRNRDYYEQDPDSRGWIEIKPD